MVGVGWCGFFGFAPDTEYTVWAPGTSDTSSESPDVNSDGVVNIQDLVLVASRLGQTGENKADVNGDSVVNIQDLVLVAAALGQGTAAAPTLHASDPEGLTAADLQQMLTQARQLALTDPVVFAGYRDAGAAAGTLITERDCFVTKLPEPVQS